MLPARTTTKPHCPAPHFCMLKCQIWLRGIEYCVVSKIMCKKIICLSLEAQYAWKRNICPSSQSISIFLSRVFRGPGHVEGPQISFPHCAELVLEYCITWDLRSACKQYKSVGRAVVILSQSLSLSLSSFTQTLSFSLPSLFPCYAMQFGCR